VRGVVVEDGSDESKASGGDALNIVGSYIISQQERSIQTQIDGYKKNQYQIKYSLWELKN
jgi:hypothetical protein